MGRLKPQDRLYRRQDGAFGHAATSEVPVEQRVRIGRGEVESAAALAAE